MANPGTGHGCRGQRRPRTPRAGLEDGTSIEYQERRKYYTLIATRHSAEPPWAIGVNSHPSGHAVLRGVSRLSRNLVPKPVPPAVPPAGAIRQNASDAMDATCTWCDASARHHKYTEALYQSFPCSTHAPNMSCMTPCASAQHSHTCPSASLRLAPSRRHPQGTRTCGNTLAFPMANGTLRLFGTTP